MSLIGFIKSLPVIIVGWLLLSCNHNIKTEKFTGTVNFEKVRVTVNSRDSNMTNMVDYKVSISYYRPIDGPAYLRNSIDSCINAFMARWFKINTEDNFDLKVAVTDHLRTFVNQVKNNRPEDSCFSCRTFVLEIEGDTVFQNSKVLSMGLNWEIYEGGAHGHHAKWCSMFDKTDGSRVTYAKLVNNRDSLLLLTEREFRSQIGIGNNEKIYQMYRFSDNRFHISNDFILSADGLTFYYNPYEIAPYVAGIIEVKLPYNEIKKYVNYLE